jgi:hypothetical protein
MSVRQPFNTNLCQGEGTIFSNPTGQGDQGDNLTFVNLGTDGARVLVARIGDVVQFRRARQGNNIKLTENPDHILFDVNDLAFDATAPIKRAVAGLQGVTLNATTVIAALQALLYPTLPPVLSLGLSTTIFEYGNTNAFVANWSVTRTDENILTISVNGQSVAPVTGNSQSGATNIANPGNANVVVPMQVTTAGNSVNTSATAVVSRKIRFGATTKDGTVQQILDADINGVNNRPFASTYKMAPTTFVNPAGSYLLIAIPDALLNGAIPIFKVGGFVNNAFTKVRDNAFVNTFGFSDNTSVWVSNSLAVGSITLEIA